MSQAKEGSTVKVSYTAKLKDGTVFETRDNSDPLEFTIGRSDVIPGFEQAVLGLAIDETRNVTIEPSDAYGMRKDELIVAVDRKQLPGNVEPEVGQQVEISQNDGQSAIMTVADVTGTKITLDGNHPLAGKTLVFDITLLEVS